LAVTWAPVGARQGHHLRTLPQWAYFEDVRGKRQYDEREYLVDGRRLQAVDVVRRYPQIDLKEWQRRQSAEGEKT
jgi:hypothetical protein